MSFTLLISYWQPASMQQKWTSGQICGTDVTFTLSVYKDLKIRGKETVSRQLYKSIWLFQLVNIIWKETQSRQSYKFIWLFQLVKIIWMKHPYNAHLNYLSVRLTVNPSLVQPHSQNSVPSKVKFAKQPMRVSLSQMVPRNDLLFSQPPVHLHTFQK